MKLTHTLSLVFLFLSSYTCLATDSLNRRVVLIQLRTEQNRMRALIKNRQYHRLQELKSDAAGANSAMIEDFRDHFTMYPVYYFADSNADQVKNRQFEGILLNADGTPVKKAVLNSTSKNHLIVYYGYPSFDDSTKNATGSGEPKGKGLIINNYKLQQISYILKYGYHDLFIGKSEKKYFYNSKHFEIDYSPLAEKLQSKLDKERNRR